MVHTFSVSSASISWNFLVSRAISINCKLFTAGVFLILVSDYVPPRACIHETWEELSGLKREQRLPDSLLSVLGDFNRANLTNELSNYTQHTTTCPPGKTGDLITVLISSKASSLRLWVGRTLTDGPAGSAGFFSHLGKKYIVYFPDSVRETCFSTSLTWFAVLGQYSTCSQNQNSKVDYWSKEGIIRKKKWDGCFI